MSPVALWGRPRFRALDRTAEVVLFVLAKEALRTDSPLDAEEQGLPAEVNLDTIGLQRSSRESVEGLLASLRVRAASDLGTTEALDSAQVVYRVRAVRQDPPDLGYLQGAWAVTRWLCSLGATAVLDGFPIVWRPSAEILEWRPDRELSIRREVSVTLETDAESGGKHILHTRGMGKFARFDLIARVQASEREKAGELLLGLAQAQALGHVLRVDRENWVTGVGGGRLVPYAPGINAPEVNLNNDGLLLEALTLEPKADEPVQLS